MIAANERAVPTLDAGVRPKKMISTGAVILPAPTPVNPTAAAIKKPRRYSIRELVGQWAARFKFASRFGNRAPGERGVEAVETGRERVLSNHNNRNGTDHQDPDWTSHLR